MTRTDNAVLALSLVALCAASTAGCAEKFEPGSPGAAYAVTLGALTSGEPAAVYGVLSEDVQADVAALLATVRGTLELVDTVYPAEERVVARAAAGAELVEGVAGPEELFLRIAGDRPAVSLSSLQRLGARTATVREDGDEAQVTTRGGDVWSFRRAGDGSWRWVPPESDRGVIRELRRQAQERLAAVKSRAATLEGLRAGRVRTLDAGAEPDDAAAPPEPRSDANPGSDASPGSDTEPADAAPAQGGDTP